MSDLPVLQQENGISVAQRAPATPRFNSRKGMEATDWVPEDISALLDVGCNVGDFLEQCHRRFPLLRLSGIDINHSAVEQAKRKLPDADIRQGYGFELPFADGQFDCLSCIEVIEHVPEEHRPTLMAEIQRVLAPGGRFILRCPHAGLFSWLDAQNFRFRFPRLYKNLVGTGNRDAHYEKGKEELVWHHHFTKQELLSVAGHGWQLEACRLGGLILFPVSDILRWPFYRRNRPDHWMAKALERVAGFEYGFDFGRSSYGILLVLKKA